MGRTKVGQYDLGTRRVNLFIDTDDQGGHFLTKDSPHGMAEITVGLKNNRWGMIVSILLHEALEFQFMETGSRYIPNPDYACANDGYAFFMDHNGFSQAVTRTGEFLADVLTDLIKAVRAARKKPKKPKKRPKGVRKGRKK